MRRIFAGDSPSQMRNIPKIFQNFQNFGYIFWDFLIFSIFSIFGYSSHTVTYNYLNFIYKLQLYYIQLYLVRYLLDPERIEPTAFHFGRAPRFDQASDHLAIPADPFS